MSNAPAAALKTTRVLVGATTLVALLIAVATFVHKSRLESPPPGNTLGGYEVDVWGSWAGPALLCVLAILGLLLGILAMLSDPKGPDRSEVVRAAILATPMVPLFAGAALFADRFWWVLIAERTAHPNMVVSIAQGLSIVRVVGWIGAASAGLLFGALICTWILMMRPLATRSDRTFASTNAPSPLAD